MSTTAFIIGLVFGAIIGALITGVFLLDREKPGRRKKTWEK